MKKLLTILVVLLVAATARADMTAWLLGETDLDSDQSMIQVRVGYAHKENDTPQLLTRTDYVEVGLSSSWWPNDAPPQVYGAYGLYHFDGTIADVNIALPWSSVPVRAVPYLGAQFSVDFGGDNDEAFFGPVAGVKLNDLLILEYQYRAYDKLLEGLLTDEHRLLFGLRLQF